MVYKLVNDLIKIKIFVFNYELEDFFVLVLELLVRIKETENSLVHFDYFVF